MTAPTPKAPPAPLPTATIQPAGSVRPPTGDWRSRVRHGHDAGPTRCSIASTGIEKTGKSHFLCTAPKPLILQFDPNLATVQSFGHDYTVLGSEEGYRQFMTEILPALWHREVTGYDTIGIDSFSFLFPLIQAAIPIPRSSRGEEDSFKWYRLVKNTCNNIFRQLCSITQPHPTDPNKPTYNLIVTCHITETYKELGSGPDKKLILDKWRPRIEGAFKGEFLSFFNSVFVHMVETTRAPTATGAPGEPQTLYVVYTVPPDTFHSAGDGMGGAGKRFRQLPPKLPNNFTAVADAWGLEATGGR